MAGVMMLLTRRYDDIGPIMPPGYGRWRQYEMRTILRSAILALTFIAACSGDALAPLPTLARISVRLNDASLSIGQSTQASAALIGSDGDSIVVQGDTVQWRSSNTAVALVSTLGVVRGVAPGSATITATANGVSGSTDLSVATNP